jgi:hypothetical protein
MDPLIRVTKYGVVISDIQLGSIRELSPAGPIGTNPPATSAAAYFMYGFSRAMWVVDYTPYPATANPTLSTCPGLDPNATPCCWNQYLAGQITLDQWNALNPGFGTRSPGNAALPLIPVNAYQICIANPPWVYTFEDAHHWYPAWTHRFWGNQASARVDISRPVLLEADIGHGPHTDVQFVTSRWTWHPCDLNGDGVRDNQDLAVWDANPYDWNFDGLTNKDDRTELSQCLVACYPDCDADSQLSANDFVCYLNAYTLGQSYADCDAVPGLTANDFVCFLNRYTTGCT